MPYHFTDTHLALQDAIRQMVDKEIRPIAAEIDATDRFPEELVPILGDMGLLQCLVPEEYDGPGGDVTSVCIAREEIAKASSSCALLAGQASIGLILPLLHFGTEEQRKRWLPLVAEGRTLGCVAITEPEAGSDVGSMRTRARRDGDSYVINGQKCFITFGSVAHWALVFARTNGEKGFEGISCFMVDTKTAGFRVGRNEKKMGLNGIPNVELFFENMRVPAENMIGEEGKGFLAAMRILDMNRPTIGAQSVGLAQGAFDVALAYTKERKQFGRAVGQFQGLQWMMADMAMQIEAARALVYETTHRIDTGDFSRLSEMSAMAKCFASDMAMKVTTDAVQLMGGVGYMKEYPLERMMRDAKIKQIYEGTNQIQRVVIARHLIAL
ncbi:acyl-CoA dehydrogenase family protein [Azoarcus sp. DN11]|uniref:acyl-CoA dehydrogenase family protein n=1 Tax=Azoarcus sp. DN11 TaxID=356837 RepID=UPI000EB3BF14|nr:acyl-CoA dehydrogenase family protein [Azoarcus sp. DN11]AYH43556.1 acyl-CoA dehydrogenase [Azoarcus sp. DN11]